MGKPNRAARKRRKEAFERKEWEMTELIKKFGAGAWGREGIFGDAQDARTILGRPKLRKDDPARHIWPAKTVSETAYVLGRQLGLEMAEDLEVHAGIPNKHENGWGVNGVVDDIKRERIKEGNLKKIEYLSPVVAKLLVAYLNKFGMMGETKSMAREELIERLQDVYGEEAMRAIFPNFFQGREIEAKVSEESRIDLDSLQEISGEVAAEISGLKTGVLRLGSITELSNEAVDQLVKFGGSRLELPALVSASDYAVWSLAYSNLEIEAGPSVMERVVKVRRLMSSVDIITEGETVVINVEYDLDDDENGLRWQKILDELSWIVARAGLRVEGPSPVVEKVEYNKELIAMAEDQGTEIQSSTGREALGLVRDELTGERWVEGVAA